MKTFLNVLYRRILYKIPLKLLLILLAVFGVLFACFSSAEIIESVSISPFAVWDKYVNGNDSYSTVNSAGDVLCVQSHSSDCNDITVNFSNGDSFSGNPYFGDDIQNQNILCGVGGGGTFSITNNTNNTCQFYLLRFTWSELVSSTMCQTEYNLIPISSVDQNYCTSNNLCPSQECPVVPSGTGNLTQLYINNILHVGAPTILMNIPDEIDWDYAYTQGGNVMNIDVVGYNVDYQAVEDEIIIQKYKPNSEELSGIISGLIPLFVPGLCIILLLYFIFKFIKKVF